MTYPADGPHQVTVTAYGPATVGGPATPVPSANVIRSANALPVAVTEPVPATRGYFAAARALYQNLLGRAPTQAELTQNRPASNPLAAIPKLAKALYGSPERQALAAQGRAPKATLKAATAYAGQVGKSVQAAASRAAHPRPAPRGKH